MKLHVKITTLLILATGAIILAGCSAANYSTETQTVLSPRTEALGDIKSFSFMQQMLDGAERDQIPIMFSVNTSDFALDDYSEGGLFDVLKSSSKYAGSTTIAPFGAYKKVYIKKRPSSQLFTKDPSFSAAMSMEPDSQIGSIKIVSSFSITGKMRAMARTYDIKSNEQERGVEDFMRFVSTEFAASGIRLYYAYDPKNKLLNVSDTKIPLISSPFRIYSVKKELQARKIEFSIVDQTSVAIEGSFNDWMNAYSICDNIDPFRSQIYVVSIGNQQFYIPEGYDPSRSINIEFEGWNKDGTRDYILYVNGEIRKLSTNQRILTYEDKAGQVTMKFY